MADSLIRPIAVNVNTGVLEYSGSLTTSEITDGTIATADLADSSVTTAKIADGTIAVADMSAAALAGRNVFLAITYQ